MNALDQVFEQSASKVEPVETKLVMTIVHKPVDTMKLKEALFEIRQGTKNLIKAVLTKHEIERVEDVKMFL